MALMLFGAAAANLGAQRLLEGQTIFAWLPLLGLSVALLVAGVWVLFGAKLRDITEIFLG
jgi:hypothetical protein